MAARRSRPPPSPEDRSDADGNDAPSSSAPSEYLAEFLSAIMRRQYAEALKYCRLILQYEPQNSTARSFYPLLEHKLRTRRSPGPSPLGAARDPTPPDSGSEGRSADGSLSSQSSLELDSPERSRSDRSPSSGGPGRLPGTGSSGSAVSGARDGYGASSGSDASAGWSGSLSADDNGNELRPEIPDLGRCRPRTVDRFESFLCTEGSRVEQMRGRTRTTTRRQDVWGGRGARRNRRGERRRRSDGCARNSRARAKRCGPRPAPHHTAPVPFHTDILNMSCFQCQDVNLPTYRYGCRCHLCIY